MLRTCNRRVLYSGSGGVRIDAEASEMASPASADTNGGCRVTRKFNCFGIYNCETYQMTKFNFITQHVRRDVKWSLDFKLNIIFLIF